MKTFSNWIILILIIICLTFMFLLVGCQFTAKNELSMEIDYYKEEDFKSITIGESTFRDVYNIAPAKTMQLTSYGGFCDYPTQDGGYIRIKFYGKDLIVGSIEERQSTD